VILEIDATGQIIRSWLGRSAPRIAAGSDVFAALDVDDTAVQAAQIQFLLASAIGAPADDWTILAGDAPSVLVRRNGETLGVGWDPVVDRGTVTGVALFAIATSTPRVELCDPAEVNRLCVDALSQLDDCDAALQHLTADPTARHCVHRIFRNIHTIKGSTRSTTLQAISGLAHTAEEVIEALRHGEVDEAILVEVSTVLRSLRLAINAARPRGEVDDAMTELLAECRPALVDLHLAVNRFTDYDVSAVEVAQHGVERIRAASERANMQSLLAQCEAAARAVDHIAGGCDVTPVLLDDIVALDRQIDLYAAVYRELSAADSGPSLLITMASWMGGGDDRSGSFSGLAAVLAQAGVPTLLQALADPDPLAVRRTLAVLTDAPAMFEPGRPRDEAAMRFDRVHAELQGALVTLERAAPGTPLGELRAIIERLSWVPLAGLSRRLSRMARTLAAELGKAASADVAFGDLVVAPELVRVLGEILVHAIRNAIDHGIEPEAERVAAGKPAAGTIHVAAYALTGRLLVTVRDDGRGVALDRVRRQAISRGLRTPAEAMLASDADLLDLLFHPGLSTATAVTSVSGRGVGMDVIRSLARERGGTVALSSSPGRGTELTIDVPFGDAAPPVAASPVESGHLARRTARTSNRHTLPYSR
jgi:two-component system chemotaxis sensor kinase CheA